MKTNHWLLVLVLVVGAGTASAGDVEQLTIDATAPAHPFPHFWEHMFGSGRAVLSLRDSYRQDLRTVVRATGATYVRFHAIFHDEMGVYDEDAQGEPVYNFSYVDQAYDGLLAQHVRPFVELSFMPQKLAAAPMPHSFWYHPNISPPKSYERWDALIATFARHLVERYGIDEVSQWYFEVWNEPNLDFWGGRPSQPTYWTLYDHTARALKSVDPRLRVGGPATAQAAWIPAFIQHSVDENVPLDFVSTHVYGNDPTPGVFSNDAPVARDQLVCRAVSKVHAEIRASQRPAMPLIWSEFNASFRNEPEVTDSAYMGPWLAETIRQCDGLVEEMSYWTFSDVFEEQGVVRKPLYGGYGLIAAGDIPKAAFNAFAAFHRLGGERLKLDAPGALLTRRADGTLVLALWNYAEPGAAGAPRMVDIRLAHSSAASARVVSVDPAHGDVNPAYAAMGSPRYPNPKQLRILRAAAALPPAVRVPMVKGRLTVTVPAHGIAVITLQ